MTYKTLSRHLTALGILTILALLYTFPLLLHFKTHFIGKYGGDVGLPLRDLWYFRHAIKVLGTNPLWTDLEYWPHGGNLMLTNYSLFNDILAYFLMPAVGMPATWNLLFLLSVVLAGYGVFLMLRDWGFESDVAIVSGALFTFCPLFTMQLEWARGLEASCWCAIPFFFWFLSRAVRDGRLWNAFIAALCLTWAWGYNNYHLIICALFLPFFYVAIERPVALNAAPAVPTLKMSSLLRFIDGALILTFLFVLYQLIWRGQREFHGRGSVKELLTHVAPFLLFWALAGLRFLLRKSLSWTFNGKAFRFKALKPYAATAVFWLAINLPLVASSLVFMLSGDYGTMSKPWRGGGNPCDPIWLLAPNLFNPLWKDALGRFLSYLHFGPPLIVSLGLLPLGAALWLWRFGEKDKWVILWTASLIFSVLMILGPWLKIFRVHTYLPLPFYFLHLLPIYNNMPDGMWFAGPAMFFLALLFASALKQIKRRLSPRFAAKASMIALGLLALEFAPGARDLFSLEFPPIMRRFRELPYGAYLPVPLGINFHVISNPGPMGKEWLGPQHQVAIQKPRMGGFLTRVSRRVYDITMADPFIKALFSGQDGGPIDQALSDCARMSRYFQDARLTYVFVKTDMIPLSLLNAMQGWPMRLIDEEGTMKLYAVDKGFCSPRARKTRIL